MAVTRRIFCSNATTKDKAPRGIIYRLLCIPEKRRLATMRAEANVVRIPTPLQHDGI
jgi:hypothetical protein